MRTLSLAWSCGTLLLVAGAAWAQEAATPAPGGPLPTPLGEPTASEVVAPTAPPGPTVESATVGTAARESPPVTTPAPAEAARPASPAPPGSTGGFWPFLQSCFCGPRIGLEANEGKPATGSEYVNFFIPVVVPIQALGQTGVSGCLASCSLPFCAYGLGPRIGEQLPARRIRTLEWFRLVPILNVYASIIMGFEAAEGRTMSEIVEGEQLRRQ